MKNKNYSSIQRWMLFLILAAGFVFNGCATIVAVQKDRLNTGQGNAANQKLLPKTIFAISFDAADTILRVKKFGITGQNENTQTVSVKHGLVYSVDNSSMPIGSILELETILKQHGIDSVKALKKQWDAMAPVIPGSEFKPVSNALGVRLFNFAIKNSPDRFDRFNRYDRYNYYNRFDRPKHDDHFELMRGW